MQPGAAARGSFRASSFADGLDRYFGWQRLPDTSLLVTVGLDVRTALLPLETRFREDWIKTGIVSAALLTLAIVVLVLLLRLSRRQQDVAKAKRASAASPPCPPTATGNRTSITVTPS